MQAQGVDALLVPSDDPHLSEYTPDCFQRRAFISGFTGSVGSLVITADQALLWTDGRYFLQAEQQLGPSWTLMRAGLPDTPKLEQWLADSMKEGQVVGLDPQVHSAAFAESLHNKLDKKGVELRCVAQNFVDQIWTNRPPMPQSPVRLHPAEFAGRAVAEKLSDVRAAMEKEGADVLVVTALDEVAYLLNWRGADVHCTPVVLAYALVERTLQGEGQDAGVSVKVFVETGKVPEEVRKTLSAAGCEVAPYSSIRDAVQEVVSSGKRIWLDENNSNYMLRQAVGEAGPHVKKDSPLSKMKAKKNENELKGMRDAHRRDGAALTIGLSQLERRIAAGEQVTEVDVDHLVTACRAAQWGYMDNSFDTICGYGANGAIIHYRAQEETAAVLSTGAPVLLDSGAQYIDGTTDVTRTMHFGEPTARHRECFTRVLKGHISLATAVFPAGTPGFILDGFARRPLWASGLDYRHGTGHGVGAALAVHEGPQRIGKVYDNRTALEPGMIVSNEPGFYSDGEFGIRIENLLIVVERGTPDCFGAAHYLGFEPLTLVPIQRRLIDVSMLDEAELVYLNAYHARVRAELEPLLQEPAHAEARAWLLRNTETIQAEPPVGVSFALDSAAAAVGPVRA